MRRQILSVGLVTLAILLLGGLYAQTRGGSGTTHTYYVAAEEVEWDYMPGGVDKILGRPADSLLNMRRAPDRVGYTYRKAIYREYTDSTFTTLKSRPPEWEHLGILGPVLRATVGDTIRVVFRNRASRPYSMHPHGVIYNKDSEGAVYEDGTSGADKADDAVPPGATHTYVWPVPERAGPGPGDPSSILWMYHSHVMELLDVNAGLMGPIIVSARGTTKADGTPRDVDREFVITFFEFNENFTWYAEDNIRKNVTVPLQRLDRSVTFEPTSFYVSNLQEAINGFQYGTTPGLTMQEGERVRWYIMASTNFGDLHAPHFHGTVVVANHMKTDVLTLTPMSMVVADMVADNAGKWLFHCHVAEHNEFGMQALFTVQPRAVAN